MGENIAEVNCLKNKIDEFEVTTMKEGNSDD